MPESWPIRKWNNIRLIFEGRLIFHNFSCYYVPPCNNVYLKFKTFFLVLKLIKMNKYSVVIALIICCFSCSNDDLDQDYQDYNPAPKWPSESIQFNNHLAFELYSTILRSEPDSNLCISPYSVYSFLGMLANAARGETLSELQTLMGLDGVSIPEMNSKFREVNAIMLEADPMVQILTANSLWYHNCMTVLPVYRQSLELTYQAHLSQVDFYDPATLGLINEWANLNTKGLIPEMLKEMPANTIFILANAVYFNGTWTNVFDKRKSRVWPFKKLDRSYVPMVKMEINTDFKMFDHHSWTGIEMPYGNESWAMYAFLPKQVMQLDKLTLWLRDNWESVSSQFHLEDNVKLQFPRFEIRNNIDLKPVLKDLGINKLFGLEADLSAMTNSFTMIDWVQHQSTIKVTEDGTEAAAITSGGGVGAAPPSGLIFDHPFVYLIVEKSTRLILFMGQVMDPSIS